MRKVIFTALGLVLMMAIHAQNTGLPQVDKSPMDVSYYPNNYPVLKIQNKTADAPIARVIYSRPQKNGRTVFGNLIEYGQVWRLGANEATEIQFFQPVKLGKKKISPGRYTLYALVEKDTWTIILNKDTDTWGAFKYNAEKDITRFEVPTGKSGETVEYLSMLFESPAKDLLNLVIEWDQVRVSVPFTL